MLFNTLPNKARSSVRFSFIFHQCSVVTSKLDPFYNLVLWYVILEHEDKNVSAELIWRLMVATIKMTIHIAQSKFYFHVQRSFKHTITYTYFSLLMWRIM